MADIQEYLDKITTARYGRDVRSSIVNALKYYNDTVDIPANTFLHPEAPFRIGKSNASVINNDINTINKTCYMVIEGDLTESDVANLPVYNSIYHMLFTFRGNYNDWPGGGTLNQASAWGAFQVYFPWMGTIPYYWVRLGSNPGLPNYWGGWYRMSLDEKFGPAVPYEINANTWNRNPHDANDIIESGYRVIFRDVDFANIPEKDVCLLVTLRGGSLFGFVDYQNNAADPQSAYGGVQFAIYWNGKMYMRLGHIPGKPKVWYDNWIDISPQTSKSITRSYERNKNVCKILRKVLVIGDSYTAGLVDLGGGKKKDITEYSWTTWMSQFTGGSWIPAAVSGNTAKTWLADRTKGLGLAKSTGKVQAYYVALGLNDQKFTLGNVSDIGTTADTFYGNYSRLLQEIHAISPDAYIFCSTSFGRDPSVWGLPNTTVRDNFNRAIRDMVANKKTAGYKIHLIDILDYEDVYKAANINSDAKGSHFTPIGYEIFAECIQYILSDYIMSHISDFQDIGFIPLS